MNNVELRLLGRILPKTAFDIIIKERQGVQLFFTVPEPLSHRTYKAAIENGVRIRVAPLPSCYAEGYRYGAALEAQR